MAWLHATPKPDERTKRARTPDQAPQISRLDRLRKDGALPALPPNPAPHIVERLIEIGLTEAAGMGVAPISWQTIEAWQRLTGIELMPWEVRLLRRLSTAYLAEGRRAESENAVPPWRAPVTQRERDAEEVRLRMVLG